MLNFSKINAYYFFKRKSVDGMKNVLVAFCIVKGLKIKQFKVQGQSRVIDIYFFFSLPILDTGFLKEDKETCKL